MSRQKEVALSRKNRCIQAIRKVRIAFERARIRASFRGVHEVRLSLLQCNLSESDLLHLYGYTAQWLLAGFQIRVQQLPEQSTGGLVAYQSFYLEGKLKYRRGLTLVTKCVETRQIAFLQEDL